MGGPGEVTADGYAQVFAVTEVINCVGLRGTVIINCETACDCDHYAQVFAGTCFQCLPMEVVADV